MATITTFDARDNVIVTNGKTSWSFDADQAERMIATVQALVAPDDLVKLQDIAAQIKADFEAAPQPVNIETPK